MLIIWSSIKFCCFVNPFTNNLRFLRDYSNLQVFFKTMWEKDKLLVTSLSLSQTIPGFYVPALEVF